MSTYNTLVKYICVMICLLSFLAQAESLLPVSIEDNAKRSDIIAYADCTGLTSKWLNGKVFTIYTFSILEKFKGNIDDSIQLSMLGGEAVHPVLKQSVTMLIPGQPKFLLNHHYILFFRKSNEDGLLLTSGAESVYEVGESKDGNLIIINSSNHLIVDGDNNISGSEMLFETFKNNLELIIKKESQGD